jgi:hypothetical protein
LKETFSELFCLTGDKGALVVGHMFAHNDVVHWDINFIILVHDWGVYSVSSFFNVLYSTRMGQGDNNKFCWIPLKRQSFEVKTFWVNV